MNSKHLAFAFAAAAAVGMFGCGDGDDVINPPPPALSSTVVDRMGRAGVNTALTDPFNTDSAAASAVKDNYNSASNPSLWKALFTARIAGNLAILDSLDTVCGNQLLAGPTAVAGRYNTLAGVLADDQIYVNAASGLCTQYLGVEANAVVVANNDCGGRTPLYDTIDTTYSVAALGALAGVGDAVNIDADVTASLDTFPFLDDPI